MCVAFAYAILLFRRLVTNLNGIYEIETGLHIYHVLRLTQTADATFKTALKCSSECIYEFMNLVNV